MFKRKAEDEGGVAKEQKVDPIPRTLPQNTITLNFTQRTWEEIAPGELYYLPLSQTVKYLFDPAQYDQWRKFQNVWETMEINSVKFRCSNLIMLQDDQRVENNTPVDSTVFTQVCYMIHYTPMKQNNYFKLSTVTDVDTLGGNDLAYELQPKNMNTQLVKMTTTYTSFEDLTVIPAKPKVNTAFIPGGIPASLNYSILDPIIAPDTPISLKLASGNLQPNLDQTNFCKPRGVTAYARNQSGIHFRKYGDVFEEEINTNLKGIQLLNVVDNDFLRESNVQHVQGQDIIRYKTEWCYPSKNRPFRTRADNLSHQLNEILHSKDLGHLKHHFFTMPPIKKPAGTPLGQRCSFLLEQSFSVTLHTSQAYHDYDDTGDDKFGLANDNGVILRRNFYGHVEKGDEMEVSPFCGPGKKLKQEPSSYATLSNQVKALLFPSDDWGGMNNAIGECWVDYIKFFNINTVPNPNYKGPYVMHQLTTDNIQLDTDVRGAWTRNIQTPGAGISLKISPQKVLDYNGENELVNYARYGTFIDFGGVQRHLQVTYSSDVEKFIYVNIDFDKMWDEFYERIPGITCAISNSVMRTDYSSDSKNCRVFFA